MTDLNSLRQGNKAALARLLARIEVAPEDGNVTSLLDMAHGAPRGLVLGLTGPPGVGKSTLIDGLIHKARGRGQRVAVIAVDPSSQRSGGALLGDRTRFTTDPADKDVFVRSMAARDRLGGVAEITYPISVVMRALYDLVVIETVGVGQSETQIADIADFVAFCAQPGSGDALQFMKSGVMEIPDVVLVTKGDLGALADRTVSDLRGALSLVAGDRPPPAILRVSALQRDGIGDVIDWVEERRKDLDLDARQRRDRQSLAWMRRHLAHRFGIEGLSLLEKHGDLRPCDHPFVRTVELLQKLRSQLNAEKTG